jgi:hypothetical protein
VSEWTAVRSALFQSPCFSTLLCLCLFLAHVSPVVLCHLFNNNHFSHSPLHSEKEMKQYGAVIEHGAFKADPVATINEHLMNTLRLAPPPAAVSPSGYPASAHSSSMDTSARRLPHRAHCVVGSSSSRSHGGASSSSSKSRRPRRSGARRF